MGPSSGTVGKGGLASHQHVGTNPSAIPSLPNPTALPSNDSTRDHTPLSLSTADEDQLMPDADDGMGRREGSCVAEDGTNGDVDLGRSRSETIETDGAGSFIPSETSTELSSQKSRKPAKEKRKQENKSQEPAPRKTAVQKPAAQKAAAWKADADEDDGDAVDEDDENAAAERKTKNPKGSKKTLKLARFANKADTASHGLYPTSCIFTPSDPIVEFNAPSTTSKLTTCEIKEMRDLLRLFGEFTSKLQREPFKFKVNVKIIDERIAKGFKRKPAVEDKDENGEGVEGPTDRPNPRCNPKQQIVFNGLNRKIKPLNRIDDIFNDLTENALKNGLPNALKALRSQKLKISTLFSGTESPLLALEMIRESEHVACSILRVFANEFRSEEAYVL